MEIKIRKKDEIVILDFSGNLDTGTSPQAESQINSLIEDGTLKILANLKDLDYISSAGLRIFLATAKKLKADGGELRLCNLNDTVQEIFDISGFSMIFNVKPSEEEALEGF